MPPWDFTRTARVGSLPVSFAIRRADFGDPDLATFLRGHLDDMAPTAPPESRHALDFRGLNPSSVRMWTGHEGGALVATGALAALDPLGLDEEVKSMRTHPDVRGRGVGRAMLTHLLRDARERGVQRLWLETGSMAFFEPARALYRGAGFTDCAPFGSYRPDPHSIFLTLAL